MEWDTEGNDCISKKAKEMVVNGIKDIKSMGDGKKKFILTVVEGLFIENELLNSIRRHQKDIIIELENEREMLLKAANKKHPALYRRHVDGESKENHLTVIK